MIRRTMAALSLGLLAVAAQPASATERNLFEPFNNTHSARTFHNQQPKQGGKGTIWLGGEYQSSSIPDGNGTDDSIDFQHYRGGIGYAQDRWQIGASFGNLNVDGEGFEDDRFVWDVHFKANFWRSQNNRSNLAAIFNYRNFADQAERFDGVLAGEHRFGRDFSGVVNIGYGKTKYEFGGDGEGFVGSVGFIWHPANWRRFTLAADYTLGNEVDVLTGNNFNEDYDNWSVKAGYFVTDNIQLTAGGGKRQNFFVGVNGRIR